MKEFISSRRICHGKEGNDETAFAPLGACGGGQFFKRESS